MKVALIQPEVRDRDFGKRIEYANDLVLRTKEMNPDIICFPEMFPGNIESLKQNAQVVNSYILCGEIEKIPSQDKSFHNNVVLINPLGKIVGKYTKKFLMNGEVEFGFKPSGDYKIFDTNIGRIGVLICGDFPLVPETSSKIALNGADILFVPAMALKHSLAYWEMFLLIRSRDNGIPTVFVNTASEIVGGKYIFGGGQSKVVLPMNPEEKSIEEAYTAKELNPQNQIVLKMGEKEEIKSIDIDITLHKKFKDQIQVNRKIAESIELTLVNDKE
jgi:predicted amidohydrolase